MQFESVCEHTEKHDHRGENRVNWESIYVHVTITGAVGILLFAAALVGWYAYKAMWPEQRNPGGRWWL